MKRFLVCLFVMLAGVPFGAVAQEKEAKEVEKKQEEDELFESSDKGPQRTTAAGEDSEVERQEDESLREMSNKELEEAGFEFENQRARRLRPTALLYSLTLGTIAHGAGHLYLEQWNVGWSLLAMEALGVGFFTLGLTMPFFVEDEEVIGSVGRPMTYAGVGLFSTSFLLDLAGIVRSEDVPVYDTQEVRPSLWAGAHYGFLSSDTFPLSQLLAANVMLDLGVFYTEGRTEQSIALDGSRYGARVGWRPWVEKGTEGQVFVEGEADLFQFRGAGRFSRFQGILWAGGMIDMGMLSRSLRLISFGLKLGYAHQWYAYPSARAPEEDEVEDSVSALDFSQSVGTVPVELSGGLSLTEKLYVKFFYTRHDGEYLQDIDTLWAVPAMAVRYSASQQTDLSLKVGYGDGFLIWGGFRLWAWK